MFSFFSLSLSSSPSFAQQKIYKLFIDDINCCTQSINGHRKSNKHFNGLQQQCECHVKAALGEIEQRLGHKWSAGTVDCRTWIREFPWMGRRPCAARLSAEQRGGEEAHFWLGDAQHKQSQCEHFEEELLGCVDLYGRMPIAKRRENPFAAGHLW